MIWTILFYYLIIFITLYLWWVIFFCSYHSDDNSNWRGTWKKGDKVKFPLWQLIVSFPLLFVPAINIFMLIGEIFFMVYLKDEVYAEFRSFLFKKL